MVGRGYMGIYISAIGFPVFAAQDIVKPEIKVCLMICHARSRGRGGIGIAQMARQAVVRIRHGGFVEIAAQNEGTVAMAGHISCHTVHLNGTQGTRAAKFPAKLAQIGEPRTATGLLHHLFVHRLVVV